MKKKILVFSLVYYPDVVGGAEVAIKEITDRVSPKDVEFDMVTLRFDKNLPKFEKIGNVNVHRIGFTANSPKIADLVKFPLNLNKYLFPFLSFVKAGQLHRERHYDAIWAMMANYAGFGAMFFKTFHPSVKYLLTLQEGDPIDYIKRRVRFVYPLFVRIFTKADFVQPLSKYLAGFARDMGYKGPMKIVPNAVNTKHFSQDFKAEELNTLKNKLGKKEGDINIITTSRLVLKNAADDVIRSLVFLPDNYNFIILGIGPDMEMLKDLAKKEGVANRVKFLGQVDHKEMPKYLKVSDVFIRPSLSEGFGNSFIEAMAADIPVVATQAGGIPDFLFDPDITPDIPPTGLFCKIRDPKDIARQIKRFMDDVPLREKILKNAKKMVMAKYDWSMIAGDMAEIFKSL
ncbi:MAG TPA: glycosyltransferase [Candidatus Paceibacterota bacterium]|nr:glycosyltransferase [Candidatus Paceibacterota bacterium]